MLACAFKAIQLLVPSALKCCGSLCGRDAGMGVRFVSAYLMGGVDFCILKGVLIGGRYMVH